jgi:hypothetical protein
VAYFGCNLRRFSWHESNVIIGVNGRQNAIARVLSDGFDPDHQGRPGCGVL